MALTDKTYLQLYAQNHQRMPIFCCLREAGYMDLYTDILSLQIQNHIVINIENIIFWKKSTKNYFDCNSK